MYERHEDLKRLADATGRVATDLAARRARIERHDGPSRLGETYSFQRTADLGLEWTVAERRVDDGNLLVLPVDDFSFAGSRDVALEETSLGGVARVRCDLGVWLDPGVFRAELRTGMLPAEDLARVRARRRGVLEGTLEPTLPEIEADEDPQYQRWRETTLLPAVAELTAPPPGKLLRFPGGKQMAGVRQVARWALPLAAAAAGVVLALQLATSSREVDRLAEALRAEQQHRQEIAASNNELEERLGVADAAKRRLDATLEELRETSETALEELRRELSERGERITELTRAFPDRPVQLPFFELQGWERDRSSRGLPIELGLGGDARLLALALEVEDPEPYLRYRLRIVARHSGKVVWETDELIKQGRWLSLVLPAGFLDDETQYELHLAGLMGGEVTELKEKYLVVVRR